MHWLERIGFVLCTAGLFALIICGCGSGGGSEVAASPAEAQQPKLIEVASPTSTPAPDGVDGEVWQQLSTELERLLLQRQGAVRDNANGTIRFTSAPPVAEHSRTTLTSTSSSLRWSYYNTGDYDQNGEVNAADLVPLALHFGASAVPGLFGDSTIQGVVDGDANGEINLADVQPIAVSFHSSVSMYRLYRSSSEDDYPDSAAADNGDAELLEQLDLGEAQGDVDESRIGFALLLPEQLDGDYFWVRPVDGEGTEGIASNINGPHSNTRFIEGRVFVAGTDYPRAGVQIDLSGDATASAVTDGNGYYRFDGLFDGGYTVTPAGDPYGFVPAEIDAALDGHDRTLADIRPVPVYKTMFFTFHETYPMRSEGLALDSQDNIYVVGDTGYAGWNRQALIKFDMFGNRVWTTYLDIDFDLNPNLSISPDDEIYLYGIHNIENNNLITRDIFLLKLDTAGNIIWDLGLGFINTDHLDYADTCSSIAFDNQGNVIVFGYTDLGPEEFSYMMLINPDGQLLEQSMVEVDSPTFEGVGSIWSCIIDVQDNMLLGGTMGTDLPNDGLVMRVNADGETEWAYNWGTNWTGGGLVQSTGIDLLLHSGDKHPTISGSNGYRVASMNIDGSINWEKFYESENSENPLFADLKCGKDGLQRICGIDVVRLNNGTISYPTLWLFAPDGSILYSKLWVCTGTGDIDEKENATSDSFFEINSYGVLAYCANAPAPTGEWQDYEVTEIDYVYPRYPLDVSLVEAEPAAVRAISYTLHDEELTENAEPGTWNKLLVMLYRP